jgi:hypothetical protein
MFNMEVPATFVVHGIPMAWHGSLRLWNLSTGVCFESSSKAVSSPLGLQVECGRWLEQDEPVDH